MPTTTNLGLAVSSNQNDSVLEYWNKMLNETDGNFVLLDNEFGVLKSSISFEIPSTEWASAVNGPFKASATVTLANTLIRDNSVVEAYFSDIVNSAGVVLYSVTQSSTDLVLVFYANEIKQENISGFIKYVYGVEAPTPSGPTIDATLENNSWDTIKSVCEAGNASNYWAVGDTKTDTGTDNNVRTFRIADMQGLYNKHVVFEQVELENESYKIYSSTNYFTYENCDMRTTHLPAIMAKYSVELQGSLTNTTYKVGKFSQASNPDGVIELTDKIFLPASKELFTSSSNSIEAEKSALTTFQYYVTNDSNTSRQKNTIGQTQNQIYWTRSPSINGFLTYCQVYSGAEGATICTTSRYVAPVFSF